MRVARRVCRRHSGAKVATQVVAYRVEMAVDGGGDSASIGDVEKKVVEEEWWVGEGNPEAIVLDREMEPTELAQAAAWLTREVRWPRWRSKSRLFFLPMAWILRMHVHISMRRRWSTR